MKEKLTMEEYKEIEQLVESALNMPNKREAEKYINKIESYGYDLYGNASNILSELVGYVKDASGSVADKERRVYFAKSKLYILGSHGVKK